ncbi:uncharacterized protein ATNIH1004_007176 [Aspergillus tanneri]|uniref:Uncharacterized protein n=1 Tax=Aspergillus tanneri TaxID=1220188 RepID=A0A5M9MTB4_9EURO|nr:uncharacterized protein ATNIH1004_007176 [Aspergillus tanneri]KAA8645757.1 hypothetical protein ATNIH1004_007176 [Aspergillus tanneri]
MAVLSGAATAFPTTIIYTGPNANQWDDMYSEDEVGTEYDSLYELVQENIEIPAEGTPNPNYSTNPTATWKAAKPPPTDEDGFYHPGQVCALPCAVSSSSPINNNYLDGQLDIDAWTSPFSTRSNVANHPSQSASKALFLSPTEAIGYSYPEPEHNKVWTTLASPAQSHTSTASTPHTSPSSSTTAATTLLDTTHPHSIHDAAPGTKAATTIGALLAAGVIAGLVLCWLQKKKRTVEAMKANHNNSNTDNGKSTRVFPLRQYTSGMYTATVTKLCTVARLIKSAWTSYAKRLPNKKHAFSIYKTSMTTLCTGSEFTGSAWILCGQNLHFLFRQHVFGLYKTIVTTLSTATGPIRSAWWTSYIDAHHNHQRTRCIDCSAESDNLGHPAYQLEVVSIDGKTVTPETASSLDTIVTETSQRKEEPAITLSQTEEGTITNEDISK